MGSKGLMSARHLASLASPPDLRAVAHAMLIRPESIFHQIGL